MFVYRLFGFFFSSRRRHTRYWRDWSSDVCSSDLVSDVRDSVHALRPPALDELGLVGALREGAMQYGPAGLRVSVEDPEELSHLPAAGGVALYRVGQEGLGNVMGHARAGNRSYRIRLGGEGVRKGGVLGKGVD